MLLALALSGCSLPLPRLPWGLEGSQGEGARRSVVRISAHAPACGKDAEGTGFVYAPGRVMTVARVVAGAIPVSLTVTAGDGRQYAGDVVAFDPVTDVALLHVPGLPAPALRIARAPLGAAGLVGYPAGGGAAVAREVEVERRLEAAGPDVFRERETVRTVLALSGDVGAEASGWPVVAEEGVAAGMVFGVDEGRERVAYALAAEELLSVVKKAGDGTEHVSTRKCAGPR